MNKTTQEINKVDQRYQEQLNDTDQGKMRCGISVETKEPDIKPSDQMAVASNLPQKELISHAIHTIEIKKTQEATSSDLLIIPDVAVYKNMTLTSNCQKAVYYVITMFKKKNWIKDKAFQLILLVVRKLNELEQKPTYEYQNDHPVMVSMIGPYYEACLGPALEYLHLQADTECSWEHYTELNKIAAYFHFQLEHSPTKSVNKEKLTQLYREFAHNEINYLDYLEDFKDSPLKESSAMHAADILTRLLSTNSPFFNNYFLDEEEIADLTRRKEIKLAAILSEQHDNTTNKRKEFNDLKLSDSACIKTKRYFNDALFDKLSALTKAHNIHSIPVHLRIYFIKQLADLYDKYTPCINEFNTLGRDLKNLMIISSTSLLLAIKNNQINSPQIKKQSLCYILTLLEKNFLSHSCQELYAACIKQHTVTRHTTWLTTKFWHDRYKKQIDAIFTLLRNNTYYSLLTAAQKTKKLLTIELHHIEALSTAYPLLRSIEVIKKTLFEYLFSDFLFCYHDCISSNILFNEASERLNKFLSTFIITSQYTFLLKNTHKIKVWRKAAGLILSSKIREISNKAVLSVEDTNFLFFIKSTIPNIHNPFIKYRLLQIMDNCLKKFLKYKTSVITIETMVALSSWISNLTPSDSHMLIYVKEMTTKYNILTELWNQPTDSPIILKLFSNLEQEAVATTIREAIERQTSQSDSPFQFVELPSCNPKHTPQQAITDRNPASSFSPHRDHQIIYQRVLQPVMPTDQPLQASHHAASIAQPTDDGHPFFIPPSMMQQPPPPLHLESFCQPPELPSGHVHPQRLPSLQHHSIPPTTYRPNIPFNSGIQQVLAGPSVEKVRHNPLQPEENWTTHRPTQHKGHQIHQRVLQPVMPTDQPLQASHHAASIAQPTDDEHPFSIPLSMMQPPPPLHLESFCQPPELPSRHVHPQRLPSLQHHSIPPTTYRPNIPFNSGIQQALAGPSAESMRHNPLQPEENWTTHRSTQHRGHQIPPDVPVYYQQQNQSISSNQHTEFMSVASSMRGTMLHQHSPMGDIVPEMDNSSIIATGFEQLHQAAVLYLKQKKSNVTDSTHKDTLLKNPNSSYFSSFKNGMDILATWITPLDDNLTKNNVCVTLMEMTTDNGHIIIGDLFDELITLQNHAENIENVKNLFMIRNFLFSIRLLMGFNKS